DVLARICDALEGASGLPAAVRDVVHRLRGAEAEPLEREADAILAARVGEVDIAAAPLLMGALQVSWVDLASRLAVTAADAVSVPGVCPVCGTAPVASIVRADGRRYLHCALCATEWHLVR